MLERATVTVDLAKIAENTRRVVEALPGVDIVAVTKVTCGSSRGRSRDARGRRCGARGSLGWRTSQTCATPGSSAPIWLLRAPTRGRAEDTVRLADVSAISETSTRDGAGHGSRARRARPTTSSRWSTSAICAKA